jgi:hypothetical protein
MDCRYCGKAMDAVGLGLGNGWECISCGHQEPELASWKMTEEGHEALLEWSCNCARCKEASAHHAMTGE